MEWILWLLYLIQGRAMPTVIDRTIEVYMDTSSTGDAWLKWLTFGVALIAVVASLTAAGVALKTWKRSEGERVDERLEARRSQAARVVASVKMGTDEFGKSRSEAVIYNKSDLPIYNLVALISDSSDGHESPTHIRLIAPGEQAIAVGKGYDPRQAKRKESGLRVALWFDDANTLSWIRNDDGGLNEFKVQAGTDASATKAMAMTILRDGSK